MPLLKQIQIFEHEGLMKTVELKIRVVKNKSNNTIFMNFLEHSLASRAGW